MIKYEKKMKMTTNANKTYFVSRHQGAKDWAEKNNIKDVHHVEHITPVLIEGLKKGDNVIGTLPIHLAAEVCAKGADFTNLVMTVPPELRGKELTAQDMEKIGVSLQKYMVKAE